MHYVYSDKYSTEQPHKMKRKIDKNGDDILWQFEHDKAVDKGLIQIMKEDKLSFDKLLAVIRKETVRDMHVDDKWRAPAYQQLDRYKGSSVYSTLSQYWIEQLAYISHTKAI